MRELFVKFKRIKQYRRELVAVTSFLSSFISNPNHWSTTTFRRPASSICLLMTTTAELWNEPVFPLFNLLIFSYCINYTYFSHPFLLQLQPTAIIIAVWLHVCIHRCLRPKNGKKQHEERTAGRRILFNDQPPPLSSTHDGRAVTRHGYQKKITHHVLRGTYRWVLDVS